MHFASLSPHTKLALATLSVFGILAGLLLLAT